ncbi:hypothetical protein ABW20_dc0109002 [Dactylellina cionopaga]|nr:hypothetical protein ABW20_dc0109002 [Dactylellina cionopaga]
MKPFRRSTAEVVLNALAPSRSLAAKTAGPIQKFANLINAPVLTAKEAKLLLNEINSSFRRTLDQSRPPDDAHPSASIHHTSTNKADDHIYGVLTEIPASTEKHDDLRGLLPPNLRDKDPISSIEYLVTQDGASDSLIASFLKDYVYLESTKPGAGGRRNGGVVVWKILQSRMPGQVPAAGVRKWLAAALLLSSRPTIPFEWVLRYLEHEKAWDAKSLLREIFTAYGRIYSTSEAVKLFLHFLKTGDKEYRRKVSQQPTTKAAKLLDMKTLAVVSAALAKQVPNREPLLSAPAMMLYKRGNQEDRKLLAENLDLWDVPQSAWGAEIAILQLGDPLPGVEYLSNIDDTTKFFDEANYSLASKVVVGLLVTNKLLELKKQTLADNMIQTIVGKLLVPLAEMLDGDQLGPQILSAALKFQRVYEIDDQSKTDWAFIEEQIKNLTGEDTT